MGRADTKPVSFGLIATESAANLKSQWEPFLKDMEKALGVPVKAFYAPDYAGVIEAMRFNKVDLAWYGNKAAIEAVDRAGGEVFAQMISADGYPGYHSVLIVHRDSPITSLDDVIKAPGQYSFGNGDPNSTSGFLVPGYYAFAKNGIDPKTHFTRVLNSNHEFNALAVANRQLDIATNNTSMVGDPDRNPQASRLWQSNPAMAEKIRVIWKSPLIPHEPIVYRKNLPDADKQKLRDFFYGYGKTPEQKAVLAKLNQGVGAFIPSTNAQLQPIRDLEKYRDALIKKSP
jgi:phosphonate transport system substrate-binding protein